MIIVTNTGPLLHLHEARCLDLLNLAGDVHAPLMVVIELKTLLEVTMPSWIKVYPLENSFQKLAASWTQAGILDSGEAEALCLAQQLNADWFLTDDAAARLLAQTLGIEVHGSLGVILWAAAVGYLEYAKAQESLDGLIHSSLWMSPGIIVHARKALEKIFQQS
jgi:predicted nucleic acid-binding protein